MTAQIIQFPKIPSTFAQIRTSVERTLKSEPAYEHVSSEAMDEIAQMIADRIEKRIAEEKHA